MAKQQKNGRKEPPNDEDAGTSDGNVLDPLDLDVPIFYANLINVRTALNDVRIILGKLRDQPGRGRPDAIVYLSLQTAKQLKNILNRHIEDYEKNFGHIAISSRQDESENDALSEDFL